MGEAEKTRSALKDNEVSRDATVILSRLGAQDLEMYLGKGRPTAFGVFAVGKSKIQMLKKCEPRRGGRKYSGWESRTGKEWGTTRQNSQEPEDGRSGKWKSGNP